MFSANYQFKCCRRSRFFSNDTLAAIVPHEF